MTFNEMNLNSPLQNALADLGYNSPTTIQHKAFNIIMSGRDLVGIAQTGTGKTLAYLLPLLRSWKFSKEKHPQILIIVPTRELVVQVVSEVEKLTKYMNCVTIGAYGGVNMKPQAESIMNGADIIVATPERLMDLVLNGFLKLKAIKKFVIDEVDEMLNLGFRTQLKGILDLLPAKRQNLMFSATMTEMVDEIIDEFFNTPEKIEAAPMGSPLENIEQCVYKVPNFNTKINLLISLLEDKNVFTKILVFTATKRMADMLHERIFETVDGGVGVIHSNKDQNYRFNSVRAFQSGLNRVLIATDIIARGLDIQGVSQVINFDMPEEAEHYIHRIGRTGRADQKGQAITFVAPVDEEGLLAAEVLMNFEVPRKDMPEEVIISEELIEDELPKFNNKNIEVKISISGPSFHEKKEKNKKVNVKREKPKRFNSKSTKSKRSKK